MNYRHSLLKAFGSIGLILTLGVSMSADAGWFGMGGTSWKEEVLLHDGSTLIVERSFSRGGRHEITQSGPIKEQDITFILPGTRQSITWTSEYSEDVGRATLKLLALHVLNGTPYIVAEPHGCLASNKWGRPNPPYVFFKHDGKIWQRIPLAEFPAEFKEVNVVIVVGDYEFTEATKKSAVISVAAAKELNHSLMGNPYHKSIFREPMPNFDRSCPEMIRTGDGGWYEIDWFENQPSLEACLQFCDRKKVAAQNCPCKRLSKGK